MFGGGVLRFSDAAEQLVHSHRRDAAIGRRKLTQPRHHPGPLTQNADARIGVEQASHLGAGLQRLDGRQRSLFSQRLRGVTETEPPITMNTTVELHVPDTVGLGSPIKMNQSDRDANVDNVRVMAQ